VEKVATNVTKVLARIVSLSETILMHSCKLCATFLKSWVCSGTIQDSDFLRVKQTIISRKTWMQTWLLLNLHGSLILGAWIHHVVTLVEGVRQGWVTLNRNTSDLVAEL
jgi:hypothetical protein